MRVGNDIVDLKDIGEKHHPCFVSRVLSTSERIAYQKAKNKERFLWKCWAAKETAYKFLKPTSPGILFAHREFVFHEENSTIQYRGKTISVRFINSQDYIYCYTAPAFGHCLNLVEKIDSLIRILHNKFDKEKVFSERELSEIRSLESLAVRVLAKILMNKYFGFAMDQIVIIRKEGQAPKVFFQNECLNIALSFTHDERFAGVHMFFRSVASS